MADAFVLLGFVLLAANLYSELEKIPVSILNSTTSVTIVPAFFLRRDPILAHCSSIMSCANESEKYFPANKKKLRVCLTKGSCLLQKPKTVTHVELFFRKTNCRDMLTINGSIYNLRK